MGKRLRSGYTTGACAAAAAKAAALALTTGEVPSEVSIPFPDGSRHTFVIHAGEKAAGSAWASVIKDAGDDPDVTNGAEIRAKVRMHSNDMVASSTSAHLGSIEFVAGEGVGQATKPGLAVAVGEPAVNPVPRQMITTALQEVIADEHLQVELSVVNGEQLAEKTLNHRLGILGGLSILGTTGIVRPVSADAWTATIQASMDVAREAGIKEIVLSTGRTSERGAQSCLTLPEEAYVMMGDYLEFSLKEAKRQGFQKIHLSGMWAKITKAALRIPQTHVRNGALEMEDAAALLRTLGIDGHLFEKIKQANTAREMYSHLAEAGEYDIVRGVCLVARQYCHDVSQREVAVYLVNHKGKMVEHV